MRKSACAAAPTAANAAQTTRNAMALMTGDPGGVWRAFLAAPPKTGLTAVAQRISLDSIYNCGVEGGMEHSIVDWKSIWPMEIIEVTLGKIPNLI
eukprot:scaffold106_cov246-Pinguiococcus_pyrenoidosus.AAC.4